MRHSQPKNITRRDLLTLVGGSVSATLLSACAGKQETTTETQTTDKATGDLDYMVLVNKQNKLPDGWEDKIELVHLTNTEGWDVDVEAKAYDAYLALKEDLEAEGVFVDLDSAYRSVKEQQRVWDEFIEEKGEEYTKLHVAVPGYSEHQTGLALDLFLIIDGKGVYDNDEMLAHPEIWEKVHAKLADYGFILRYLPRKKIETGYSYEAWHIRFLNDPKVAKQIAADGITYERYLKALNPAIADAVVDYGDSKVYADTDMDAAFDVILGEFVTWKGCKLKRLAFTDDETCTADLDYVNELREAKTPELPAFDQAIVFVTDFHSPSEEEAEGTAWEPNTDYLDYSWHLGRTGTDGAWNLLTWGKG